MPSFIQASIDDIAWDMNSMIPSNIPRFKIRAINPFLKQLESYLTSMRGQEMTTNLEFSIFKVVSWVVTIMESANRDLELGSRRGKKVSKTDKLLASIASSNDVGSKTKPHTGRDKIKSNGMREGNVTGKRGKISKPTLTPAERREIGVKRSEKERDASSKKNKSHPKIPKIEKKLCTLHTEMLNNVFARPLFLTLLGPSYLLAGEDATIPDRFVVKIYDPLTSTEAEGAINTREYTLLLRDLQNQFDCDLTSYFMPISYQWWVRNLRNIIAVKAKPNNKLSLLISKKKIGEVIKSRMDREENGQDLGEYFDDFERGGYIDDGGDLRAHSIFFIYVWVILFVITPRLPPSPYPNLTPPPPATAAIIIPKKLYLSLFDYKESISTMLSTQKHLEILLTRW